MKIGLVCPYNVYKGGGVQECVLALKKELDSRGHEALIITPQPSSGESEAIDGVRFVGVAKDVKSPFATTAQVSVSVNTDALDALLEKENFDILHFHEPWVPILSWQILARSKSKNIATFHAKLPETAMAKTFEKVLVPYTKSVMKYFHDLTAVSDAAAEYASSLTKKPIDIIPNGIDLAKFKNLRTKKSDNFNSLLYIGRLEKRKGVKYLLRAFELLNQELPDMRLFIVGDGPDRQSLMTQVKNKNIKNVEFLGYVEEAVKLKLISEARLMVSPALFGESFGIVLLEAMASGVPIVAGNNPGYSSVMQGYGNSSLVNPKNSIEFAERIRQFTVDGELRDKWLEWSQNYIKNFDYPKIVSSYENLYKELVTKV